MEDQSVENKFVRDAINKEWKSTCKVIFGQEIGSISEYHDYLSEPIIGKKVVSAFSGKELWVTSSQYSQVAKFFDYTNEMDKTDKILAKPLNINEIKDFDSLLEAVKEKFIYSSNKILGNSKYVLNSDNITDSMFVLDSSMIVNGKHVAYSYLLRKNEYCFASTSSGDSVMIIRCFYNNSLRRCFECILVVNSADCYFCHNMTDSTDCIFTFNERAKRNVIGNIQLTKEQYAPLKQKLLSELADDLKRRKRTISLLDVLGE